MTPLSVRHEAFAALHQSGCFVIPNPWDAGSARMMAAGGAAALATTSAGFAFTLGRPDMGTVTRDEALAHAQEILAATALPVSGDFENGFGDTPDDVAETVRRAGEIGLSGCSIEDTRMVGGAPAYEADLALERIRAGVSAARALGRPFVFCARADGVMNGSYDVAEALRRLQAFEAAGADLLYAPLLPDAAALETVVAGLRAPLNVLAVGRMAKLGVAGLAARGVRRISLGSALARATHALIHDRMTDTLEKGDFSGLRVSTSGDEIDAMLIKGADDA